MKHLSLEAKKETFFMVTL